jgi:EAL domain-containing protein (putative c-di-GMP-specific phosphodiesterase class I)
MPSPVDILKVDKMFVDTIVTDPVAAAFLEAIVHLGGILALSVIVEGIESAAQVSLIARFDEVLGQGYQLGRPMGIAAIDKLLSAGSVTVARSIAV